MGLLFDMNDEEEGEDEEVDLFVAADDDDGDVDDEDVMTVDDAGLFVDSFGSDDGALY